MDGLATSDPRGGVVVLGKTYPDSPHSYEQIAYRTRATYFDMGDAWAGVRNRFPAGWPEEAKDLELWRISQQFLDDQIAAGKAFRFTSDPYQFLEGTFCWMQFEYLLGAGYEVADEDGSMETATVEQVRGSVAYRNVTIGMHGVFPDGWRADAIYPQAPGLDFVARVTVNGFGTPVYVCAGDTHTRGMFASGPGGRVTVCVPTTGARYSLAPDGVRGRGVHHFAGTEEEKAAFRMGVGGANAERVAAYLRILERYLQDRTV